MELIVIFFFGGRDVREHSTIGIFVIINGLSCLVTTVFFIFDFFFIFFFTVVPTLQCLLKFVEVA